ncbi:extracellular solute-binding protein [Pelagibius sp.]|uniref:extracellular solute-binding protein n=1 Tax=Pelagibius sp. TaxID=1931238 RepID=UPI00262B9009|nr:extracellular solute-binding protein [Pelagibius sp.]
MTDSLRLPWRRAAMALGLAGLIPFSAAADEHITKSWAIAEFGEPLYDETIEHWPYANPDAPKGGTITLGAFGTFDTFNPYILKGEFPGSIGLIYDSLMEGSADELVSAYGVIAESVEYPEDKSWAIFNIRPEARFHDGVPITAADFKFTFDTIREHGRPFLKSFYDDVESAEVLSDHRIRFNFRTRNSMKPITIVAGTSPQPRHYWETRDISRTTLEPPLGSGPYRIKSAEPGRTIVYERVEDYWAADLPVNRGRNNFDIIRYEYYRDQTVQFEAFKAGKIDYRSEGEVKRWFTGYDIPQVNNGQIVKVEKPNNNPRGIGAFFINNRRDKFKDKRVREAIVNLYDFEAIQRTLLYGQYRRIKSYFPNSDFGVSGPPTPEEIAILEPYRDQLPPEVLSETFEPPKSDGSGRNRQNLRRALALFKEAGWELRDNRLVNAESGEQFQLQIITASPPTLRMAEPFVQSMRRAGIDASIRLVDPAQWRVIGDDFDFDLSTGRLNFFPPPGTELRSYFGSEAAGLRGSANSMGIKNPVADELIEQIINAEDLETLKATTRALDRVLLWNHYLVPVYYPDKHWFAYWDKFGMPEKSGRYSAGFSSTWWYDEARAAKLTN